jgi:integrase/recombinase XerD
MNSRGSVGRHPSRTVVTGPLAAYVDGFREDLAGQGYSEDQVRRYCNLAACLSRWLDGQGLAAGDLASEAAGMFLRDRRQEGCRELTSDRALAPLLGYLQRLQVVAQRPDMSPAGILLGEFRRHLRDERGLAVTSIQRYLYHAKLFLAWLPAPVDAALATLSAGQVTGYVVAQAGRGVSHAGSTVTALRSLLRFLHQSGHVDRPLAQVVPRARGCKSRGLVRAVDAGQVAAVLEACDRRSAAGCRNYAVILLMARLGLRACEVASAELGDINWRAGELTVRGKGGRADVLPLPQDVGEALAGYLRHGRPRTASRQVFVSVQAPFRGLGAGAVPEIVAQACARAGIPRFGSHRFRHALACELLARGAPLTEIGQLLRHASQDTTAIYAKVDLGRLAGLAMPCPDGQAL